MQRDSPRKVGAVTDSYSSYSSCATQHRASCWPPLRTEVCVFLALPGLARGRGSKVGSSVLIPALVFRDFFIARGVDSPPYAGLPFVDFFFYSRRALSVKKKIPVYFLRRLPQYVSRGENARRARDSNRRPSPSQDLNVEPKLSFFFLGGGGAMVFVLIFFCWGELFVFLSYPHKNMSVSLLPAR